MKQTHCALEMHKFFYGPNRPTRSHVRWKFTNSFTDETDPLVPMCIGNAQILLRTKQTHSFPCALEMHKFFYGQNRPTLSHVCWKCTNSFTDETGPHVPMCIGNAQILLRMKQTHSFPCALEIHQFFYG